MAQSILDCLQDANRIGCDAMDALQRLASAYKAVTDQVRYKPHTEADLDAFTHWPERIKTLVAMTEALMRTVAAEAANAQRLMDKATAAAAK